MTWEAAGVIAGTLVAFAAVVSGGAWLTWKRLARLDDEVRGDVRLDPRDKQAMRGSDTADPWWSR